MNKYFFKERKSADWEDCFLTFKNTPALTLFHPFHFMSGRWIRNTWLLFIVRKSQYLSHDAYLTSLLNLGVHLPIELVNLWKVFSSQNLSIGLFMHRNALSFQVTEVKWECCHKIVLRSYQFNYCTLKEVWPSSVKNEALAATNYSC